MNALDLPLQQTTIDKPHKNDNHPVRQTPFILFYFIFFFGENIGTATAGPAEPVLAPLLCQACTSCSVLYSSAESVILLRAEGNDVSEHAHLVYSSESVAVKNKKNNPK